jgi:sec-independent protein translocase protein TatC
VLLAAPILLLMMIAVGISLLNDKRRARKSPQDQDFTQLDDDEISPLDQD